MISAIQNENRVKYRLILDLGAKKKLDKEPNIIIPKSLSVEIKEKHEIKPSNKSAYCKTWTRRT